MMLTSHLAGPAVVTIDGGSVSRPHARSSAAGYAPLMGAGACTHTQSGVKNTWFNNPIFTKKDHSQRERPT